MNATLDAFLRSWPHAPGLAGWLLGVLTVYTIGWRRLARRDPQRWPQARWLAFAGGLAAIYLALASPVAEFSPLLLQMHMVQHLLLMMVAPPLIWLGTPLFPLLGGLPEPVRRYWVAPLLRSRRWRAITRVATHPAVAWPLFVAATWLWHSPAMYELALARPVWHLVEHAVFLGAALAFWHPVVRPYPSRPRWSLWLLLPYLLAADVQNTVLAAGLTFSSRVLYSHYEAVPRVAGLSALADQAVAGVLMWVPGSVAFLLPLAVIAWRLMQGASAPTRRRRTAALPSSGNSLNILAPRARGLRALRQLVPLYAARRGVQFLMLGLALLVIWDGFRGPAAGPMNLAGVAPWIHWRGAVVIGLLVVGNVSCLACPFTLPRTLLAGWLPPGRPWPRVLRNKWLAVALVAAFLWSYEALALWDSPWLTAWIASGYFVAAFVVDTCFRGAAFCKFVCPIGQFNFVQSLLSPLEVGVREPARCARCHTHDCLRGGPQGPGCGLQLFQPAKLGNFDCTFCFECARACPHDNVALVVARPSHTLTSDAVRSGIGRLASRADVAALVAVLSFGALANAAGMVAPVVEWQVQLSDALGGAPRWLIVSLFYALAIVVLPFVALTTSAALAQRAARLPDSVSHVAARFALALVPLGFAMWLAHYSFHLLTSFGAIVPVVQRLTLDSGVTGLGDPAWASSCCAVPPDWLWKAEVLALDLGLLASLYVALRVSEDMTRNRRRAFAAWAPWAVLITLLFGCGVWIVFQPMEMRGTFGGAG